MTKYRALVRFSKSDGPGFIEPGEPMPDLPREIMERHLELGHVEVIGKPDPSEPERPSVEEIVGKKFAEVLSAAGFSSWDQLEFATDEQLMSVEGMTQTKFEKIREIVERKEE